MDYEFRRDLYGEYSAQFSMGYEILGLWLVEELGKDSVLIEVLLLSVEQLQNRQRWEYRHSGREINLLMSVDGIEVHAALLDDEFDEAPFELNHYDQESSASCGLDDFRRLLEAWRGFVLA